MNKSTVKKLLLVGVFAVAMGYLETVIVVYLRIMYYPGGFGFPLIAPENKIIVTELVREAATLVMLVTMGMIAGRTSSEKFGFFIYTFAVWDIFYYVFLKIMLNWPESLFTWDLLFLIPVLWIGPVIGPVINSLSMIVLAVLISFFTDKNLNTKINPVEWGLFVAGSVVVIVSYTYDYVKYMLAQFGFSRLFDHKFQKEITEYSSLYIPEHFGWGIYLAGELLIILGIFLFVSRNLKPE